MQSVLKKLREGNWVNYGWILYKVWGNFHFLCKINIEITRRNPWYWSKFPLTAERIQIIHIMALLELSYKVKKKTIQINIGSDICEGFILPEHKWRTFCQPSVERSLEGKGPIYCESASSDKAVSALWILAKNKNLSYRKFPTWEPWPQGGLKGTFWRGYVSKGD